MEGKSHIYFTVTNDLVLDQRMQRICTSLHQAGYGVTLVGRLMPNSAPLPEQPYRQVRLSLRYHKGKRFYLEYNLALYQWLCADYRQQRLTNAAICAIDLDTLWPCYRFSRKMGIPRVYDAHELFTELTEVKRRPMVHKAWLMLEKWLVPRFRHGYTVNQFLADEFRRRYGVQYAVIRNMPFSQPPGTTLPGNLPLPNLPSQYIWYQGAVNEGRAWEQLIPAMQQVPLPLLIAGTGNYVAQVNELIKKYQLTHKVQMLGAIAPAQLRQLTPHATIGITLFNNTGLNQYYSLANRFFDYVQAGVPQLCNHYPEYAALNAQYETSLLIDQLTADGIAAALNKLLNNRVLYRYLQEQCALAALDWCWENESKRLVAFWAQILPL